MQNPERNSKGIIRRISGRKLQRIRKARLRAQPLCQHCLQATPPRIRVATVIDHIIALANGGPDTEDNRQNLCDDCHLIKTRLDLGYKPKPRIGLDGWPEES